MVRRSRSVVLLQEQMQVPDLVQDDWEVDDPCFVDLVQLLNRIVFLQVKTEHAVHVLPHSADAADQQYLFG